MARHAAVALVLCTALQAGAQNLQVEVFIPGGQILDYPDYDSLVPDQTTTTDIIDYTQMELFTWMVMGSTLRDDFALRIRGSLKVDAEESFTFYLHSDDGARLLIDGKMVVDNGGPHDPQTRQGTVSLSPGIHDLEVDYFQRDNLAILYVDWESATITRERIPATHLLAMEPPALEFDVEVYTRGSAWPGANFPNYATETVAALSRTSTDINFPNLASFQAIGAGVALGNFFALRLVGNVNLPVTGLYHMHLTSDDGSLLIVDGVQLIDNGGAHFPETKSASKVFSAGWHTVEIQYIQMELEAELKLVWVEPTAAPPTPAPPTAQPTPAPATPAPATPAPATPAPATPAPATPAPATPSPPTPVPLTPAPPTPVPQTPAPLTPAPLTPLPLTPSPLTPSPLTPSPVTPSPLTPAPLTPSPLTPSPVTPSPLTPSPLTPSPLTPSPVTPSPLTPAPLTPSPLTPSPQTVSPVTPSPLTPSPLTPSPQTASPLSPSPLTPSPLTLSPLTPSPLTQSPPTPAPLTPSPLTPSPLSPSPLTASPLTPSPLTPAPLTPSPLTPSPLSPSPLTPSPLTASPLTPSPLTPLPLTPSPMTPSPLTSSPLTPSPLTSAPATSSPLTPVPVTPLPLTSAPTTAAPLTPTPTTPIPVSSVPVTPLPATLTPAMPTPTLAPGVLPPPTAVPGTPTTPAPTAPLQTTPETGAPDAGGNGSAAAILHSSLHSPEVEVAVAIGAAAAALSGVGTAGSATRLLVVLMPCSTSEQTPRTLHPTQWVVAGSEGLGAVVGNLAIAAGFAVLCFAGLQAVILIGRHVKPGYVESADMQGLLSLPSVPLFVFAVLYQGTSLGAMRLLMHPPSIGMFFVGFGAVAVCVVVPLLLFRDVVRHVPSLACYYDDEELCNRKDFLGICKRTLLGRGDWVNTDHDVNWVRRYSTVVRMYRQTFAWFSIVEFTASLAISAIGALDAESAEGCGHKKAAMGAVLVMMFFLKGQIWPHSRFRNSCLDFVVLALQAASALLMAVGYHTNKDDVEMVSVPFESARMLAIASIAVLLAKVATDGIAEAVNLYEGRIDRIQKEYSGGCTPVVESDTELALVAMGPADHCETTSVASSFPLARKQLDTKFSENGFASHSSMRSFASSHDWPLPSSRASRGPWPPVAASPSPKGRGREVASAYIPPGGSSSPRGSPSKPVLTFM